MDLQEIQTNEFRGHEQEGDTCLECLQGQLIRRENRTDHSEFLGCDCYPECRYTLSI